MHRITSNTYFDTTVRNIQESYEELVRLQNQVQTQKAMERPSDDPVRANQAIVLESNLKEIQQYLKNAEAGSDELTFADQMLDNLMVPLNTAIEKVQQGLNAEQDSTSRQAIAAELNSILDTFVSIANTQLGDKSIFGGTNYLGEVFTRLGDNILFNGNNDIFSIGLGVTENLQTNLTSQEVFGTSSTILNSEHDLNTNLGSLALDEGIPFDTSKELNVDLQKVQGRNAAVQAFVQQGLSLAGTEVDDLRTNMDAIATASYDNLRDYRDAVRDAAAEALTGVANSAGTLTLAQSQQVKAALEAASAVYESNVNVLTFGAGEDESASKLSLSLSTTQLSSLSNMVDAINEAVRDAAGVDGTGDIDYSNVTTNARVEVLAAFKQAGDDLGLTTQGDLATQIDSITVAAATITYNDIGGNAISAGTTSNVYAEAVRDAAITAIDVLSYASSGTLTYNNMTSSEQAQVDAAFQAAQQAFATTEFKAAFSRSGFSLRHDLSDRIFTDEGSSDPRIAGALGLNRQTNRLTHVVETTLETTTAGTVRLGADRVMTLSNTSGHSIEVQLREGDSVDTIAQRINREVNKLATEGSLQHLVATVDATESVSKLVIQGNALFSMNLDNNTEMVDTASSASSSISATFQDVATLRGGAGIQTGRVKIYPDRAETGFSTNLAVLEGDSFEYLKMQIDDLEVFDVSLNDAGTGLKLQNMARYVTAIVPTNPAAPDDLTFTDADNISTTVTFTGTTLSQMAEDINGRSGDAGFSFHAEVNIDGTGLVITSNESISLTSNDAAMTVAAATFSDLTTVDPISSTFLTSLGLGATEDDDGLIEGQSLLGRQVKLAELNGGEGIEKGSFRVAMGSSYGDVDLSSATTLQDVKVLIEAALPDLVEVSLNASGNGIAVSSTNGDDITITELNGGATARSLYLITPPSNTAVGADIQGGDLNAQFSGETLLKDLNGGQGVDSTGFTITNGDNSTSVTLDSDGDGVDDIHTLNDLVNHINQKAIQDDLYVEASINAQSGALELTSKLSNTSLSVEENTVELPTYRTTGIPSTLTDNLDIFNAAGTKSITVNLAAATSAQDIVDAVNAASLVDGADFTLRAVINEDGNVDLLSDESVRVSDASNVNYTTTLTTKTPSLMGESAADFGLLGNFSDSTLLSSLNNGAGIENGSFIIKYGSLSNGAYTSTLEDQIIGGTDTDTVTFWNENGTDSVSIDLSAYATDGDVIDAINDSAGVFVPFGLSAALAADGTGVDISSSSRFTATSTVRSLAVQATTNSIDTNVNEVTVDLEFATTLGDVKRAVEDATNNEVLVNFGASHRIEMRLASGDDTQGIEIEEISSGLATASTLGLIHLDTVVGRDLRDGRTSALTSSTTLEELGYSANTSTSSNSLENQLVLISDEGNTIIDLSTATTVGDVISRINTANLTDDGDSVEFLAKIVNGRYITIENTKSGSLNVLQSDFSDAAEKLGLVPDPELIGESHFNGTRLEPRNQADNFFSTLTNLRDEFQGGTIDDSFVSNMLDKLTGLRDSFLESRGEAGGRIARLDMITTRYEEESLFIEGLYGDKTGIDLIAVTQRYLQQQQVYEAGLSTASRILGTSLFAFI